LESSSKCVGFDCQSEVEKCLLQKVVFSHVAEALAAKRREETREQTNLSDRIKKIKGG
jgi:hypothetical protein